MTFEHRLGSERLWLLRGEVLSNLVEVIKSANEQVQDEANRCERAMARAEAAARDAQRLLHLAAPNMFPAPE
jgi:hypothetical protein